MNPQESTTPARPAPAAPVRLSAPRPGRALERRALSYGFAASAALHLLAVIVSPLLFRPDPPLPSAASVVHLLPPPTGTRIYEVIPVSAPDVVLVEPAHRLAPQPPARDLPTPLPAVPAVEGPVVEAPAAAPAARPSLSERLGARPGDRRLWAPLPPSQPKGHDLARERLHERLQAINDSIAAEEERARQAMDWTLKGQNGEKWGVSPGALHLGKVTLPLPLSYGLTQEQLELNAKWAEIQAQVERAGARDQFDDRVRAIRARRDGERAERKKPETGGN
jgi:hypothetical protein